MKVTADTAFCKKCDRPLREHVTYLEAISIPPDAVEAEFDIATRGFYCPRQ